MTRKLALMIRYRLLSIHRLDLQNAILKTFIWRISISHCSDTALRVIILCLFNTMNSNVKVALVDVTTMITGDGQRFFIVSFTYTYTFLINFVYKRRISGKEKPVDVCYALCNDTYIMKINLIQNE